MTIDVPAAVLLPLVGGALIAMTGWVVRAVVFDRLKALEAQVKGQATRFGEADREIEKSIAVLYDWKARVEGAEQSRRDMSGVVR